MKFRRFAALLLFAAITCGGAPVMAGKADDTLVWATDREIHVPLEYYNDTREVIVMARHVFDTLLYREANSGKYVPLLATSYRWLDDLTLEFELRRDVTFHNSKRFNADDVVSTFNHLVRPDSGVYVRRNVSWMKQTEKLGDYKVRIHLKKPFPAALEYLSGGLSILPAGIWKTAKTGNTGKPDYGTVAPIGTGPYKVTGFAAGESMTLTRNDSYFDGPKGQPAIGTIQFRTVSDPEAQIAELLAGNLDWIWDVPKDKAEDLRAAGAAQVVNAPTMRISYLSFDTLGRSGDTPFKTLKVRQAVAHAIDRKTIARTIVGGSSSVIHSACYPTQFGCTQEVRRYNYDPEKARRLLAEAGYPNGFATDIYAYRQREFTEAAIGYLTKVGIKTNLKFMPYKSFRWVVLGGTSPLFHSTWGSGSRNDVSAIVSVFFKGGRNDYCRDDAVRAQLEIGDNSTDPAVRQAAYKKALTRIQEKLCWLPMFTYAKNYAFSKALRFTATPDELPRFYAASWK